MTKSDTLDQQRISSPSRSVIFCESERPIQAFGLCLQRKFSSHRWCTHPIVLAVLIIEEIVQTRAIQICGQWITRMPRSDR